MTQYTTVCDPTKDSEDLASSLTRKLCTNDYYQRNWISGKTWKYPTYYFDLFLSKADMIEITMWFPMDGDQDYNKTTVHKLFVLSPNGRVIRSIKGNRKGTIKFQFHANVKGNYVLKYYLQTFWDELYYINIKSLGIGTMNPKCKVERKNDILDKDVKDESESSIVVKKTKIRVYSLFGVGKQGSFYKGEQLKEKCMDRTIQQHRDRHISSTHNRVAITC